MPSKFYAASGTAYTTPAAFFAPVRREPTQLHPALRPAQVEAWLEPGRKQSAEKAAAHSHRHTVRPSKSQGQGRLLSASKGHAPEQSSRDSSASKLLHTGTIRQNRDKPVPVSRRQPGVNKPPSRGDQGAEEAVPLTPAHPTRIRGVRPEVRRPKDAPHGRSRRSSGVSRAVGEVRFFFALLRSRCERQMPASKNSGGCCKGEK